jgi:REP element-mobilizing transposase RayT
MPIPDCYRPETTTPAYSLRWSWTGWPSKDLMPRVTDEDWCTLAKLWEQDSIRLLEHKCDSEYWQATVSTKPIVTPFLIVSRIKGRIDHLFRSRSIPFKFSRKVSLRAIGNNTTEDVQEYIRRQVDSATFCDLQFAASLKQFTRVWKDVHDFDLPAEVTSGRYWYRLHLVLVVEGRHRIRDINFIGSVFEVCQAIALDRADRLAAISVMPDHLHLSIRGNVADSPETVAIAYMNETCRRLKAVGLWQPSYYVGTTGAYNMNAVRR